MTHYLTRQLVRNFPGSRTGPGGTRINYLATFLNLSLDRLNMLTVAVVLAVAVAAATGSAPEGRMLWSNLSEAGPGLAFGTALGCGGGDIVLVASGALERLHPATGHTSWRSSPLHGDCSLFMPPPRPRTAVDVPAGTVAVDFGVAFCVDRVDDGSGSHAMTFDLGTGHTLWDSGPLGDKGCGDMVNTALAATWFGCAGNTRDGAQALGFSVPDGKLLFNVSLAKGSADCDGYRTKAACVKAGCGWDSLGGDCDRSIWFTGSAAAATTASGTELALFGTVEGQLAAPGSLVAVGVADGSIAWRADGVTASSVFAAGGVVLASVDTRPMYGGDSKIAMVRGYHLANGTLIWQRSTKNADAADGFFPIGPACDVDCRVSCGLAAAGVFGAIDPSSGATAVNISASPGSRIAMVDGVQYSIHWPTGVFGSSSGTGVGMLVASSCASDRGTGVAHGELWSAVLPPVGEDGGDAGVWNKGVVVARASTTPPSSPSPQQDPVADIAAVVVVIGGHHQGPCFRGHCQPSYSAAAAFQAPPGIIPPPVPPAPAPPGPVPGPSKCLAMMMSTCAAARDKSVDVCAVCCGEHSRELFGVGCVTESFLQFCHTATCRSGQQPPRLCPDGSTCPACGDPECNCPPPPWAQT